MNLLNAYTITSTPGLVADGYLLLDAAAWERGEISTILPDGAKCPAWATEGLAKAALLGWELGTGKDALLYAGLSVWPLQKAINHAHGGIERMHMGLNSRGGWTSAGLSMCARPMKA